MAKYLISFTEGSMHVSENELPAVAKAAHAVVDEAKDAGVWIIGGGLKNHSEATIVTPERTLVDDPDPSANGAIAGFALIEVPTYEEALEWAAEIAVACRCDQEVRELLPSART
ncbi:MAG: YciI family protein [Aeromicrobium sp.]